MIRTSFLLRVGLALLAISPLCHAQTEEPPSRDSAIAVIRAGVLANKTTIVAQAMNLDDKDAEGFWPIFRRYEYQRSKLDDERVNVVKEYLDKYPDLSDSEAKEMAQRMFESESRLAALKKKYFNTFNKVLPAFKVTQFFQLERRIDLIIEMKVDSTLPPLAQTKFLEQSQ